MLPGRLIPIYIFVLLFWAYVAWNWYRWYTFGDGSTAPNWRKMTILFGFILAPFSTGLDIFMTIHAIVTGGYAFITPLSYSACGLALWLRSWHCSRSLWQRQIANSDCNNVISDAVSVVR